MTRQLRLAYGVKTDVGRRRERNQDNVTKFVPTDPKVLEDHGALFVVCDGMGGHAAGEVAAEKGVTVIRDTYYTTDGQDVITSIARAIKEANDAIYVLAHNHTEYSGMGTTCVTLVVAGGRAYIVNIGDSRAYIVRDGEMRQVTQDHSWVGEQVRMGLLTEEQARVHAHRNVITRSLGTQPNITADLFVETLHDGDRILLCSDGLHGYVEEKAIMQEVVTQTDPAVAVQNLIDMANANGGPDNISAIVVDILEAPEVTGPIPLPANSVEAIEEGTTQPLPVPTEVAQATTAIAPVIAAEPAPAAASRPARAPRKRGNLLVLRLLEIAALLAVIGGGWYLGFGPPAAQRAADQQAQTRLANARQIIQRASGETPTTALQSLAQARAIALNTASDTSLDASVRSQAQTLLDQQLTPAVQRALQRYNTAALITPASLNPAVAFTINCVTPSNSTPTPITATSGLAPVSPASGQPEFVAGSQVVYFISGGALYEALIPVDTQNTPVSGETVCAPVTVKGVSAYISVVGYGPAAYALAQLATGRYSIISVKPGALSSTGAPTMTASADLDIPPTTATLTHLAIYGSSAYLSYVSGSSTFGVWYLTGLPKSTPVSISLPAAATSIVAINNTLYLLLADGSLGQLNAAHDYVPLTVAATPPATLASPETYTAATPVPTPQDAGLTATPTPSIGATFGSGAEVFPDPLQPNQFLLSDPATKRILRLQTAANGPGVGLVGQFVYGDTLNNVGDITMTGQGTTLNTFAWTDAHLVTFTLPAGGS